MKNGRAGRSRTRALAAAAVMLLATLSSCGGGGRNTGGQPFDFNGTWTALSTIVESNLAGYTVGMRGTDTVVITQSGTTISGTLDGTYPLSGTCDPVNGTFSASGSQGPVQWQASMRAVDADTLTGQFTVTGGSLVARFDSTMELVSRSRSAGTPAVADAGTLASVIGRLQPRP